jgi:hypothetical protein
VLGSLMLQRALRMQETRGSNSRSPPDLCMSKLRSAPFPLLYTCREIRMCGWWILCDG